MLRGLVYLVFRFLLGYKGNFFVWLFGLVLLIFYFSLKKVGGLFFVGKYYFNGIYMDNFRFFMVFLRLWLLILVGLYCFNNYVCFFFVKVLCFFVIVCFLSRRFFFFYIFFELSIVPIFFIIIYFGLQPERLQASGFMIIYTVVGSFPIISGFLML